MQFKNSAKLRRENINPKNLVNECPYIGLEHIGQSNLRLLNVGSSKDANSTKQKFYSGDILFGKLRPYFRKVIRPDFDGVCSTDIWVIQSQEGVDQGFLYYWVASWDFVDFVNGGSEGTRMPRAKWDVAETHELPNLSLSEQKAIAHILGALDDKIELNQKMNQTLEEVAKAIFKSWFVDFDPVRAKAEGRPTCLPPEISDLFPDELVDSEIGEIPKGWVLKPIYDLADFINGAAYKKFEPNKEGLGLPIIKIAELKAGVSEQTGFSTVDMGEKYLIRQRDILFSWSGNPDTSIDTFVWQRDDAWLNQHIFKVIPTVDVPRSFLLQLLRSKKPVFTEIARNKQTTGLGHVTVKDLKEMQIALPELRSFNPALQTLEAIQDRVFMCERENLILSELRDTLLPKLISGELRIPDAEKFLEEAGI
jgi:type I restriction enzyme S subunit